jgi:hypothetical protein
VAENPTGDTGSLHFARGICGGCTVVSGSQLVVSVTFKALTAGTANVNFDSGTLVVRSSDSTAEPNLNEAGGTYTIAGTTTPPPPPTGGGGGTTTPPPSSPPASSAPVTHKTTSKAPASSAPVSSSSPSPAQPSAASGDLSTATPSTATTEPPLIPASAVRLLKIGGVALILATAITVFVWALGRMRTHLHVHLAPQHNFSGGAMALPPTPVPPVQPVMTITPASQNTPPSPPAKTAASSGDPGKPQPGTVLQPNSNKKT